MGKFYFTFGAGETQPFYGGWVEVVADSRGAACDKFSAKYPNKDDCINCAFIYSQEDWDKTIMAERGSNRGHGCHEVIE